MFLVFLYVLFCGSWVYVFWHRHLLVMMLSLEMMAVGIFGIMLSGMGVALEEVMLLLFLTFAVCEGSVGLGVLVGMVRSHGSDMFGGLSYLQC